ncbi:uncharacterized protein Z519_05505 [Cladophialophora bantiana CBS 173.52]|uniref:Uncharacterized protein n=1 Tax=Cladophialophora bantiana (strain ATCC 10958 / CBS 173.52 / CDC B-1940 / NIH 8579) TaxID=1442370 RepID=A0A0D2IBJ1_CLAB1|nr:uncharacterized protein Z519_05505 [Cladophialophora bantiana CBS 173.52]KIW94189.1 hypothetical protein Z519_05505 [Cladophialophora bantiana CBS 173.52]
MVEPRTIQKWPGNGTVPTSLSYRRNKIYWGFQTQQEDEDLEVHDWFKIFLDKREYEKFRLRGEDVPPSHADVKSYYRDFLKMLYAHIKKMLGTELPALSFEDETIEFIFSVPTTWSPGVAEDLRTLAREAGFGQDGVNHSVEIGLTEAEAAAVCTLGTESERYTDGDIMLVVDAGGGTTDLALLKAEVEQGSRPTLKQLDEVRGDEIGSVEIDVAFARLAEERLLQAAPYIGLEPSSITSVIKKMCKGGFKVIKEEYGTEDSDHLHVRAIVIPGIAGHLSSEAGDIQKGKLMLKMSDMKRMFDTQLEKMYRLIDSQLNRMRTVAPHDQVKYLVLSGGLGSSEYVFKQLEKRYVHEQPNVYAPYLRIVTTNYPHLSVVKGLLIERLQKLKFTKSVLRARKCRQSLGILCEQLYDPVRHRGAKLKVDPTDGLTYAVDQISWFIRQGDLIETESIERGFHRNLAKGAPREPYESRIVLCNSRTGPLPSSMKEDGVELCCVMRSDLTAVDVKNFEKVKKHWWQLKKKPTYYKVVYNIRFMINAANIESELWFNGKKYSTPNSFRVQFESGMWRQRPKEHLQERQQQRDLAL